MAGNDENYLSLMMNRTTNILNHYERRMFSYLSVFGGLLVYIMTIGLLFIPNYNRWISTIYVGLIAIELELLLLYYNLTKNKSSTALLRPDLDFEGVHRNIEFLNMEMKKQAEILRLASLFFILGLIVIFGIAFYYFTKYG